MGQGINLNRCSSLMEMMAFLESMYKLILVLRSLTNYDTIQKFHQKLESFKNKGISGYPQIFHSQQKDPHICSCKKLPFKFTEPTTFPSQIGDKHG